MSDTPRTDAMLVDTAKCTVHNVDCVLADFARVLERELSVARKLVKKLFTKIGNLEASLTGTVLIRDFNQTIARVETAEARVKELEAQLAEALKDTEKLHNFVTWARRRNDPENHFNERTTLSMMMHKLDEISAIDAAKEGAK